MKILTSVEAQNRFGELLDLAQRSPVTVTRRGRPVAFVVSPEEMRELLDARSRRSRAAVAFERYFRDADQQLKPAAKKLTETDVQDLVNALR